MQQQQKKSTASGQTFTVRVNYLHVNRMLSGHVFPSDPRTTALHTIANDVRYEQDKWFRVSEQRPLLLRVPAR